MYVKGRGVLEARGMTLQAEQAQNSPPNLAVMPAQILTYFAMRRGQDWSTVALSTNRGRPGCCKIHCKGG